MPPLRLFFRLSVIYELELEAYAFSALSCDTTVENDCESVLCNAPRANPKTTATSKATNANTAPYSVIPCPDSSDTKVENACPIFIVVTSQCDAALRR